MSFGSTPDTILFEVLFSLVALAALVVLALLAGLLRRLLRIRNGYFTLLFVVIGGVGTVIGLSLYLDTVGTVTNATITKKLERVGYRAEGDWRQHYELWASYPLADGSAPLAHFTTDAAHFDGVREGATVAVRTVSINGWFNLVRLADQSTWTWIPWRWLAIALAVVIGGIVAWRLLRVRGGWLIVVGALLVLGTWPFFNQYQLWQHANDPRLTPLTAGGAVQEVHEVTTIDPLPGEDEDEAWETETEVTQRYAIVTVRYTPQGYREPILGVDAIDLSDSTPPPAVDSAVELAYAAGDPRAVRIAGYSRNHYIRNPLAWLREQLLLAAFALALILALTWFGNRWQRLLRTRVRRPV